jgi:hypothetical protein
MWARFQWGAYDRGKLAPEDEARLPRLYEEFRDAPPIKVASITSMGMDAVAEFRAKIEEHNAKLAVFDGIYLTVPDRNWQGLTQVTGGLRQVTLSTKVPTFVVTQTGPTGEVGYSRSFKQDCTGMMKIRCEPDNRTQREAQIEVPVARNSEVAAPFMIHTKPAWDFSQKRVFSEGADGDIKDDSEGDNPEGEGGIVD